MLGLGSSLLQGGALRSIVRSGLQLFYKADRTQAPLGEEQVRNNSFDEIGGNLVSNPTFDLGSEEVVNGDFTIDSDWTKRNGSTINNVANVIAGGSIGSSSANWSLESLANVFEPSKTYQIKFRAKQVSLAGSNAGTFQVGNSYGALFDEVITSEFVDYTFTAQTSSNYWPKLTIGGRTAGDVFQIDNVSVKEVPNWVLSSASVSNNKCTMTSVGGASTYFYQTGLSLTQNKSYKISFKATRISGDTNLAFSSFTGTNVTNSPTISQSGEYSFDFTPSSTVPNFGLKRKTGGSGAVWEIESFSVKQLDPNNRWNVQNPDTPSEQTVEIREGETYINYDHDGGTQGVTGVTQGGVFPNTTSKYEIEVELGEVTGQLKVQARGISTIINSSDSNTTKVILLDSSSDSQTHIFIVRLDNGISGSAFVKNVSVKEITNSIKDHSKNSNDGILYSGKALEFDTDDGSNDFIVLNDANLPGEFTVCTWVEPHSFNQCNIFGDDANENWIRIHSALSIKVKINDIATGYSPIAHGGNIALNKWSRVVVTRGSDNIIRFGINGTLYSPSSVARAGNFSFNRLGVKESLEMNGALADVQVYDKAWNATDVKYDWENPDKDVFDRVGEAQVLGHERISYPNLNETGLTGWNTSNTSSPDYTITATEQGVRYVNNGASSSPAHTFSISLGNNSIVSGKTYSLEVVISEFRGTGGIKFASTSVLNSYPPSSPGTINFNSAGTHTHVFTAGDNLAGFSVYRNSSNVDLTIKSISIKEVTTHASHILPTDCKSLLRLNEGAGDRVYDAAPVLGEDQMESRNGSFELGAEEVVDGNFPIGTSAWLVGDKWTIANNSARLVSNTTDSSFLQQNSVFEIGKIYNLTFDATVVLGTAKFIDASGGTKLEINQTKTYNFTFEADRTDFRINRKSTDSDITIENISVKEMTTWSYVDSIELNDSGVFFNNSNDNIFQNFDYIDGATYAIGFEGTSDTGLIRYRTGFAAPAIEKLEVPIPGTAILRPDSTSQRIQIFGPSSGTATVSKVTIKEIKPAESFFITGDKNFIHQQPYIPQYAMSSYSKKAFFDGVNDYASNGTSLASISRANNYSVSLWFVPYTLPDASVDDRQGLFQNSHASTDRNGISIFPDGTIRGGHYGDIQAGAGETLNWNSASSDNSVELGKLYHVVYTNEAYTPGGSNGTKLYINGVLQSGTVSTYTSATVGVYIGKNTNAEELSNTLIDEVSVFSKTLSQTDVLELYNSGSSFDSTGHSKYNLGEKVSNGTFELGSEEVVNGDFSDGETGWLIQDGWSVTDNKLNVNTDDGNQFARQNSILEVGKTYVLTLDVSLDVGEIKFESGGTPNFIITTSDTTISHTFVATLTDVIFRRNVIPTRGYIDNVSVKEIPNWSFANGWGLNGNTAVYDGTGAQYAKLIQTLSTVVGRTYQMTFTLSGLSSGKTVNFGLGRNGAFIYQQQTYSSNGTYTRIMQAQSIDDDIIVQINQADANCTVSNISVQEYGLSAYWRNNGADQWDDLSINSNHGTVSGSPTEIFLQEVPFFGKDSLGMFMNKPRLGGLNLNASGYVNIEDNNDLDFGTGAFTMECWVTAKYENVGSSINVILGLGGNTSQTGSAGIVSFDSNKLGGYVDSATLSANSTFTEGNWYHVVITRSSGTCKLYIDTVLQNDTETSGGSITNSNAKQIGKDTTTTRGYDGVVDDVKLYSKALTQAEISKNYNATKGKHKN